jgi:penicillin-binding protein 1A
MRALKYAGWALLGLFAVGLLAVTVVLVSYSRKLPSLEALENYQPRLVTTVYADDDRVIAEHSTERRKTLSPDEIPTVAIRAFVAAEDDEFFNHRGINPVAILRAALKVLRAGHAVQGGSTITQQVAKSILLTPEKSLDRKIKEMLLAFRMEKALTKNQILALYLNQIFLGQEAYGIEGASQTYFGKPAANLTVAEAAILAGLPRAPSRDNPIANPKFAKQRQAYVLGRMLSTSAISRDEYEEAMKEQVKIRNKAEKIDLELPYFNEHVRRYIAQKYGTDLLYGGGLKVYTTVNVEAQKAAENAIHTGLRALDKRSGLRKPAVHLKTPQARQEWLAKQDAQLNEKHNDYKLLTPEGTLDVPVSADGLTPIELGKNYQAVLIDKDKKTRHLVVQVGNRKGFIKPEEYKWVFEANAEEIYTEKIVRNPLTQLEVGNVITVTPRVVANDKSEFALEQEPLVQGALLSYRMPDGALTALVGGYDYAVTKSEFNRAIQAVRQPGSAFKPIIFAAALDQGLTPSTIIVDSPIVYKDVDEQSQLEKIWRPDNATDKFYGETTLRNALAFSRNIPTIKLLQHIKIQTAIDYSRKLGIKSNLSPDLSIALGSSGMTPDELVKAWGVLANKGRKLNTYFIRRIEDRNGQVLEEYKAPAESEQILPETTAYLITNLLQSVVDYGTGVAVKALGRPVAGKTGTTSDSKDAWFLGYVPQMITGVWVGFDEDRTLGRNETGTKAAAPIWLEYMQEAVKKLPSEEFTVPAGIIQVQVDSETGDLPSPQTKKRLVEVFADGTAPGQIPAKPQGLPGATSPSPAPSIALGPDGNPLPNRTVVITGNPGAMSAPRAAPGSSEDVNADELFRNEL